jgi:hypothetical protein
VRSATQFVVGLDLNLGSFQTHVKNQGRVLGQTECIATILNDLSCICAAKYAVMALNPPNGMIKQLPADVENLRITSAAE